MGKSMYAVGGRSKRICAYDGGRRRSNFTH